MALAGGEMTDVISFEKILRMLGDQRAINFPPGSEYAYSNTGYNLLAKVIEVRSGQSFRDFTRDRIFAPLGMARTHFSDNYLEVVPGRAESYAPTQNGGAARGDGTYMRLPNQLTALASSSLHTTMDDFLLWMQNYEHATVGGRELVDRMTVRGILTGGDTIAYAHGLSTGEYRGLATFGHGGSWAGYRTNFVRFPEHGLSIAVFCNVTDCDPAGRARRVAEVYLGDLMEPETPTEEDADEEEDTEPPPAPSPAQLQELEGSYRSPELDMTYRVRVEDGALVAFHWRNGESVLLPATEVDAFTGDRWWFPEVNFVPGFGRCRKRFHRYRDQGSRSRIPARG